jgi:hypothetical protein
MSEKTSADTAAPDPAADAVPPPRRPPTAPGVILILVVVTFLVGALAASWPRLIGSTDDDRFRALEAHGAALDETNKQTAGSIDALRRDLEALQGRVAETNAHVIALETSTEAAVARAGGNPDPRVTALDNQLKQTGAELQALTERVATLESTVPADLAARLNSFALKAESEAQALRLTRLEEANTAIALKRAAAVLALADLARAAATGAPFSDQLAALAALEPDDAALAQLTDHASGVPTGTAIAARFPEAARAALAADRRRPGQGWWPRLWNSVTGLVSIRRVGDVEGTAPADRLARAQTALDRGDLAAAAGEAEALTGPAAEAMAPWLKEARARLTVDRAIAQLDRRVLAALGEPIPLAPPGPVPMPAPETPAEEGATPPPAQGATGGGG